MTSRSQAAFCLPKSRIARSTSAGSLTDIALPASAASAGTQEWRTTARWNRLCLRSSDWTGLGLGIARTKSASEERSAFYDIAAGRPYAIKGFRCVSRLTMI